MEKKVGGTGIPIPADGEYIIKSFAWDKMDTPNTLSNILLINENQNQEMADIKEQIETAINTTAAYQMSKVASPGIGTTGGDWTVFALARAGCQVPETYYKDYYSKVISHAKAQEAKSSKRWDNKVTDVERVAIALTAIGKDPTNVGGVNLLDYIWNKADNFPGITPDGILGSRQGANELIFGLLALDGKNYEKAENVSMTKTQMINKIIINYQLADGGFALSGQTLNFDITAMAI